MKLLQLVNRTILALVLLVCFSFVDKDTKEINSKTTSTVECIRICYKPGITDNEKANIRECIAKSNHFTFIRKKHVQGLLGDCEIWEFQRYTPIFHKDHRVISDKRDKEVICDHSDLRSAYIFDNCPEETDEDEPSISNF
ncbi:hypothetical protein [uncultured Tenacibaculum sp.]|uniref:hypothetical protein n=1 Tax=uncultured Tenacibaculum sp. TaxID=174713 RepID=UPI00261715A2|nr:hypothetical protein [uncultured Tenacibaculum sp.]